MQHLAAITIAIAAALAGQAAMPPVAPAALNTTTAQEQQA